MNFQSRILCFVLFLHIFVICFSLYGQEEFDITDYPSFYIENSPPPTYPFSVSGQYISVDKTKFCRPSLKYSNLLYRELDVSISYMHPFNSICGLIFGSGLVRTEVDMKDNPYFSETIFNYLNFSAGIFTKSFTDWTWTLSLAAFLDLEELSLSDYALYQGVLWGKYLASPCLELDFGLITEIGLKKDKVWPIVGFIYSPSDKWKFNVVYPINIALEYEFSPYWKLSGSVRFLRNRHRVQKEEALSQGIFEYRTTGGEVDIIFSPFSVLLMKGFFGHTFKGDLEVTDFRDENSNHLKFRGSYYYGASAVLSF